MNRVEVWSKVSFVFATFMLGGCASYGPTDQMIGADREYVVEVLGNPSSTQDTFDGQIMKYPRGPYGKHTYFVYVDHHGTVIRWAQVLHEKNFKLIKVGMAKDEVVSIIGESKIRDNIAVGRGHIWSWRYVNSNCFWFRVEFTTEDIVKSTMYQKPPECRLKK